MDCYIQSNLKDILNVWKNTRRLAIKLRMIHWRGANNDQILVNILLRITHTRDLRWMHVVHTISFSKQIPAVAE